MFSALFALVTSMSCGSTATASRYSLKAQHASKR
jgi:hypothetical protein